MTPAAQLIESLAALRRQWRQRVLLEAVVWIGIAMLLSILAGQLITSLFGSTSAAVMFMRGLGYLLILGVVVRYLVRPLLRRTSDARFALYVEERAPALRQSLLSAVHELNAPVTERASPSLTARLVDRTLAVMQPLQRDRALERPRVMRAMRSLGVIAVAVILLVTIGPWQLRHTARQLFAPWSVAEAATPTLAVRVRPGNAAIPRGAAVDVKASLDGFVADGAELVFRSDSTAEWTRLPMARDSVAGTFTSRVFDLVHATEYFVDANGIRSPTYTLRVTDLPALSSLAIDLRYPAYTGLATEHIKEGGDVAAVVGTIVTIHATITKPVRAAVLAFDNGSRISLVLGADGLLSASFPVRTTGFYRVDLIAPDGVSVPGSIQYAVEALPDRPPAVKITEPGRDTKVTSIEEVTVAVSATDDYGVESLALRYRVNGGDEHTLALSDSGRRHPLDARATHTFFLEELTLVPGDLITYHAIAKDGAGHEGVSDVYFLEVRPFGKNYRQSEQQGGGGRGSGGDSPDGFVARQREVVAGTFNWIRDSTTTPLRTHREDIATLNIAEGRLREEVAALARRIAERGAARTDTTFMLIQRELEEAVKGLQSAEEKLVKSQGKEALPVEQQALTRLQRAEELYRNVQVQMGGGGGGGGGGGSAQKAEELADLFELQTDKLHNQYEAVQQESQQQSTREVDATLERLKQLAARQQQENERAQKLAEAMREKLGRQQGGGGGGGGGSQRELAKQAEEEARTLKRLAREQKSQELSDAAQQMQQAADAMKRAATGSSAQGSAALEQLGRASRGLEGARSAAMTENVRKLSQQAKDLQDREQEIADGVKALGTAATDQRGEQVRKLAEKKDALAKDVDKLEAAADRAARDGRRDQPAAAGKLGDAANAIRDQRVRDKIDFSKNVLRSGSIDYANAFEGQIGENLKDVADKMRAAAGALTGESAARGQEKTLERARDLVKGLESLRQRVGDKTGQGSAKSTQSGQQGQGGQAQRGKARGGDTRQLSREFALRRQNAEALRGELQKQGIATGELDRAIDQLRRLENSALDGDPQGIDQLQASVIDGLKTFEFALYRRLGLGDSKGAMLGSSAPVPAEYRAAVEEYYRSLAGARGKP